MHRSRVGKGARVPWYCVHVEVEVDDEESGGGRERALAMVEKAVEGIHGEVVGVEEVE
jgi:hypothetical protein